MLRAMMLLNMCVSYDMRMWEKFEAMELPPEAFIEDAPVVWEKLEITERNRTIMGKALASNWVERELDACGRHGIRIVTCRDAEYPHSLAKTGKAPILLYIKGNMLPEEARTIAVVGTRRCSSYGYKVAREIGRRAANAGWNVVSGGAKGIDGAAHFGCAEDGGLTAAVLGTGADVVYPPEHKALFERIIERGVIYSEYPLGAKGEPWHFPKRNRIIAGLASKIIVVEAPAKSGAMITATHAAEEGREVWAVPGRIDDARSEGTNRLIFDGAMPLVNLESFFESKSGYAEQSLFNDDNELCAKPEPRNPSPEEKKIMSILSIHGEKTIDNLANEAKMSAAEVFKIISLMSAKGLVFLSGPGRYSAND